MQDRTPSPGAGAAAGQTSVPTSLLDAVMDVDAAVDDGGLELQEALSRMHEELAHLIPGSAESPDVSEDPAERDATSAPVPPERESSRS